MLFAVKTLPTAQMKNTQMENNETIQNQNIGNVAKWCTFFKYRFLVYTFAYKLSQVSFADVTLITVFISVKTMINC